MPGPTLAELTAQVIGFRDAREWQQFHNPKDVALSLMLEAAELLEWTQWHNGEDLQQHLQQHKADVAEELSDVLYWALLLAHDLGIDLAAAFEAKLAVNAAKYPVDKARGSSRKYTRLDERER